MQGVGIKTLTLIIFGLSFCCGHTFNLYCLFHLKLFLWCHDTQHNDFQHNDTQQNMLIRDNQHK